MSRAVACNDAEADPCKCRKPGTIRRNIPRFSTVSPPRKDSTLCVAEPGIRRGRRMLDTETLIMLPRVIDPSLPAEPLITAVTLAELQSDPDRVEGRRTCRTPSPPAAGRGRFRSAAVRCGSRTGVRPRGRIGGVERVARSTRRAYDAMIAATAVANGLPVLQPE